MAGRYLLDKQQLPPHAGKQSIKTLTDSAAIMSHLGSRFNKTELLTDLLDSQDCLRCYIQMGFIQIYSFKMRKKCLHISVKWPWLPAAVTVPLQLLHYLLPLSMVQLQDGFDCIYRVCLTALWELITTEQLDNVKLSQVKTVKWESYVCKFHPLCHSSTLHWDLAPTLPGLVDESKRSNEVWIRLWYILIFGASV